MPVTGGHLDIGIPRSLCFLGMTALLHLLFPFPFSRSLSPLFSSANFQGQADVRTWEIT
jgi:hypothetical protein